MLSITPDQMAAAGSYISREWGDHGYRIEAIESPTFRVSLFHVCASDGARFVVGVDKWGNTGGPVESHGHGHAEPGQAAALAELVSEMHAKASAA